MPELRKDPITGRWVIISTERGKRPMDFLRDEVVAGNARTAPFVPSRKPRRRMSYWCTDEMAAERIRRDGRFAWTALATPPPEKLAKVAAPSRYLFQND